MQNEEFDPLETDLDLASLKKELIQPKLTPDQLQSALQRYVEEMSPEPISIFSVAATVAILVQGAA